MWFDGPVGWAPQDTLNDYLPPYKAAVDAGRRTASLGPKSARATATQIGHVEIVANRIPARTSRSISGSPIATAGVN